mmetsp:Transcript_77165/g.174541  ORF Transcript_77165/g.174541 Transcript_77165/m.174541 type:complete len:209 (-) Transcript_77165:172-798(-)
MSLPPYIAEKYAMRIFRSSCRSPSLNFMLPQAMGMKDVRSSSNVSAISSLATRKPPTKYPLETLSGIWSSGGAAPLPRSSCSLGSWARAALSWSCSCATRASTVRCQSGCVQEAKCAVTGSKSSWLTSTAVALMPKAAAVASHRPTLSAMTRTLLLPICWGSRAPTRRASSSPAAVHTPCPTPHCSNDGKGRAEKLSALVKLFGGSGG